MKKALFLLNQFWPIIIVLIVLLFWVKSCYNGIIETRANNAKKEYDDSISYLYAKNHPLESIDIDQEKAVLCAIKAGINKDTAIMIVKEYLNFVDIYTASVKNPDSTITLISQKYRVSKKDIGELILNYKYHTEQ